MGLHKRHRQASKLLVNWIRPFYECDGTDVVILRSNTCDLLKALRRKIDGTIKADSLKRTEKLTEQSKLNDEKLAKNDATNRIYKIKGQIESASKPRIFQKTRFDGTNKSSPFLLLSTYPLPRLPSGLSIVTLV